MDESLKRTIERGVDRGFERVRRAALRPGKIDAAVRRGDYELVDSLYREACADLRAAAELAAERERVRAEWAAKMDGLINAFAAQKAKDR